jgi:hypothetical protein
MGADFVMKDDAILLLGFMVCLFSRVTVLTL